MLLNGDKMKVIIKPELYSILPNFTVCAYHMEVTIASSAITKEVIAHYESKIKEEYSLEDILNIPLIKEGRDSYKRLGKDPSRYRLACESLLRRLVKGYGLYPINNVVDVGNILSIALFRSVCVVDYQKLQGDIIIRLGQKEDVYYGIGRGLLNVENIPLYQDDVSPFGSPTSDTERTMITDITKEILVMVICFDQANFFEIDKIVEKMFIKYTKARNIQKIPVIKG